jgi:hypothetical protein
MILNDILASITKHRTEIKKSKSKQECQEVSKVTFEQARV